MKRVRFLVVDEADRMVETGHFAEMEHILRLVQRPNTASSAQEPASASVSDPFVGEDPHSEGRADMQTFVFSATLSKGLQRNLKKANRKFNRRRPESSTLDDLMGRIDFRDDDPVVIDLSPERGVAEGLTETKIECMAKDKASFVRKRKNSGY